MGTLMRTTRPCPLWFRVEEDEAPTKLQEDRFTDVEGALRLVRVDIKKILASGVIRTVKLTKEEELESLLRARERKQG